ncbi:hypothetical protein TWF225_006667 [Orbilia oligospora]|uniref:Uncharacterized protein n=1 Tax=Orbilia oligospora TaxID=2813651 RepID=A0A7C8KIC6_ORBOL|nr:hypothetical protein TWF751_007975 [Orbilia oligospora]KAF3181628.1 hypothetical protein TWF225_006667 [Orbilia oligospora]KAF3253269.1 hypothetical protein TWF217_007527 [Orbilia oligospora]KAF3255153.1 hypothetical protein TWF128_005957 [Orbilia oligospora]KAF3298321.1 hypothetical protein TWF132_000149 [Orbilia oligospora]
MRIRAYASEPGATSSRLTAFHKRGIHEKVYRNWLSPGSARTDSSTYDEVLQRVKYELYAIKRRARSDSPESAIFVGDGTKDRNVRATLEISDQILADSRLPSKGYLNFRISSDFQAFGAS